MFKYTTTSLEKLEQLITELGYKIRYEKGNFKAGYCIINTTKVCVINKFFTQESRINTLLEIVANIDVEAIKISEKHKSFYESISKHIMITKAETPQ